MSKMKTKSGAKQRFRMTGSGKVRMNNAFMRHMQTNKPQKMKRKARGTSIMCDADARIVKVYMPYDRKQRRKSKAARTVASTAQA